MCFMHVVKSCYILLIKWTWNFVLVDLEIIFFVMGETGVHSRSTASLWYVIFNFHNHDIVFLWINIFWEMYTLNLNMYLYMWKGQKIKFKHLIMHICCIFKRCIWLLASIWFHWLDNEKVFWWEFFSRIW